MQCKITRPASEFGRRKVTYKDKPGGYYRLQSQCKHCTRRYYKSYYAERVELMAEKNREYYRENRERVRAKQKEYKDGLYAPCTYRLDFTNGTYWIGSTVSISQRVHMHRYCLTHGKHSKRTLEMCGGYEFKVTVLANYPTEAAARDAELKLLEQHVGLDQCLNTLLTAVVLDRGEQAA